MLRRIKKGQITQQDQIGFFLRGNGLLLHRLIRNGKDLHAIFQHLIHNGVDAGMYMRIAPVAFSLMFNIAACLTDFVNAALDNEQILFTVPYQDTGKLPLVIKRKLVQFGMLLHQFLIMLFLSRHLPVSQNRIIQMILYPCMVEAV